MDGGKASDGHKRRSWTERREELDTLLDLVKLRRGQLATSLDQAVRHAKRNAVVRARPSVARPRH